MKDELKKIIIAGTIWLLAGTLLVLSLLGSGEGIGETSPKYNVDPDLEKYLVSFVDLAALKGIDLNYIYDYDITIKYTDNQTKNYVATSFGRNKDKIIILVKRDKFAARTEEGRKYVMYHELGHDVLNFEHLENPKRGMMEPTAYTGFFKNYERFNQERQSNYLYKSLNKMFNRYLGKADDATDWALKEKGGITINFGRRTQGGRETLYPIRKIVIYDTHAFVYFHHGGQYRMYKEVWKYSPDKYSVLTVSVSDYYGGCGLSIRVSKQGKVVVNRNGACYQGGYDVYIATSVVGI